MKVVSGVLVVLALYIPTQLATACPGCDPPAETPVKELAKESTKKQGKKAEAISVAFEIKGMSCGGCATSLSRLLTDVKGVISADVSYDESQAQVNYIAAKVTVERLMEVIKGAGYEVSLKKES